MEKRKKVYNALKEAGYCCMTYVEGEGTGSTPITRRNTLVKNTPLLMRTGLLNWKYWQPMNMQGIISIIKQSTEWYNWRKVTDTPLIHHILIE